MELANLFEFKFLLETDRYLRAGHSVSSAINDIIGKAAWMIPHESPTVGRASRHPR